MRFYRKSSTKSGLVVGFVISLCSFIAIHIAFIVVHELVNEATPYNTVSYYFDRKLEFIENLSANVRGKVSFIELHTHHASERIEELEHMFLKEGHSGSIMDDANTVLTNASHSIQIAIETLESYTESQNNDLRVFTTALEVESTTDDITRRLNNMKEYMDEEGKSMIASHIDEMERMLSRSKAITKKFDVEESIADQIRIDLERRAAAREKEEPATNACVQKNETCQSSRDCCTGSGLECSPVILSDGSRSKRCINIR
ncbi:hypothetical protein COU75_00525 [Candidatus Peregrinibacteria bacterium CG10_big_fil_rev_8_21_14_0_10_42_8]|nr:MAG: hypothetical protein COU75_00525 [Candidatus Peregrinibacteria bacterium CG10_big_fil_rev_8_21_14_0_10_42_8]